MYLVYSVEYTLALYVQTASIELQLFFFIILLEYLTNKCAKRFYSCPSVRPSVCHTRALWQNEIIVYQHNTSDVIANHGQIALSTGDTSL